MNYQLDKAIYLKNCENKDKPNLHCDGKCYLKKQMGVEKSDPSKEPKLPESFREIKDLQLFCEPLIVPSFCCAATVQRQVLPPFQFFLPAASIAGVFRPPAAV